MPLPPIERTTIGRGVSIPRMISGLWQLVDDKNIDLDATAHAMKLLVDLGLDCFDMADHYADAGRLGLAKQFAGDRG
ncbi:hypothetical protein RRF57_004758 [Xylaria bambusicola]|uniref:NADP-dependent oxidoreductase domain-containing protein n=1 Tax=Xylaria bambusicola TaxID=326684 RepID=A0AAN7UKH3_9PEZI